MRTIFFTFCVILALTVLTGCQGKNPIKTEPAESPTVTFEPSLYPAENNAATDAETVQPSAEATPYETETIESGTEAAPYEAEAIESGTEAAPPEYETFPETNESIKLDPKSAPIDGGGALRPAVGADEAMDYTNLPFNADDLFVEKDSGERLPMASTLDDVLLMFGEPMNMDELNDMMADAKEIRLEYSFAQIDVVLNEMPQTISSITLRDATLSGPRGLRVGSSLDDVLATFPKTEPEEKDYEVQYLYRGNTQYPDLPSRGRILYDDAGEVPIYVIFDFPITPYTFDNPDDFVYQSHAGISYTIADNMVISINLTIGSYAD